MENKLQLSKNRGENYYPKGLKNNMIIFIAFVHFFLRFSSVVRILRFSKHRFYYSKTMIFVKSALRKSLRRRSEKGAKTELTIKRKKSQNRLRKWCERGFRKNMRKRLKKGCSERLPGTSRRPPRGENRLQRALRRGHRRCQTTFFPAREAPGASRKLSGGSSSAFQAFARRMSLKKREI